MINNLFIKAETTFLLQGQQMWIPYISNRTDAQGPAVWMLVADQLSTISKFSFVIKENNDIFLI